MKITAICTRISVLVGTVTFCAGAVFAQQPAQPAAFQPAPAPLQLQQPVQAQPPSPPPAQGQPPQVEIAGQSGGAGVPATPSPKKPEPDVIDAESSKRHGVELSVEALAAAPYLHYDNGKSPGVGKVARPKDRDIYQRFDKVTVKPIEKELPFKIGDTVDVLKPIRKVKIGDERARLVARTARGVVIGFAGKNAVIILVDMWGKVVGSERVAKSTPFLPFYVDNKSVGAVNLKANVVVYIDRSVTPYMHQYIVVDKGSDAGVKLGDFFTVKDRKRPNILPEELVEAQALNVTAKASTLLLQKVYADRLRFGDEADLSFRAAAK